MSSVIVAATPVSGHSLPLLRIAGLLHDAGHTVTFVGGTRFLPAAAGLGVRTRPLTGRADYDERDLATAFPATAGLPPGLERLNVETAQVFGETIPDQHAVLQQALADDPDAVVVTDILFAGAFPAMCGAGRRPRRFVSVGIAPLYVRSVDTSPFGPVPPPDGADDAAANLAAFDAFTGALASAFEHITGVAASLGARLPTRDWVSTLYELPDVVAQLSVPQFEFPRTDLPSSIRFTGIVPPSAAAFDEPDWWAELSGDRPVVLVTQGTLANRDLTELVRPTLDGLAGEDALVVAALGRPVDELPGPVPSNVWVIDYVPFDRLLPHVDVVVTNGGYGGTQQALAAGVPVVVAGASEDKPATAARVAFHRVGVDLHTQTPPAEAVRAAVQQVLGDAGFRERAGQLAQAYGEYDAGTLVERLVVGDG